MESVCFVAAEPDCGTVVPLADESTSASAEADLQAATHVTLGSLSICHDSLEAAKLEAHRAVQEVRTAAFLHTMASDTSRSGYRAMESAFTKRAAFFSDLCKFLEGVLSVVSGFNINNVAPAAVLKRAKTVRDAVSEFARSLQPAGSDASAIQEADDTDRRTEALESAKRVFAGAESDL
jgi:hypothetical protein